MASSPPATQTIGILVFDGFEPIDVFGFAEAFSIARFVGQGYADPRPFPFEIKLIASKIGKVASMNGPSVMPDYDFPQALAEPMDLLMIPGGGGLFALLNAHDDSPNVRDENDPTKAAKLLDWVRAMDQKVSIMASVCVGAALLAEGGLLDGLPAATNHDLFQKVARYGPRVLWDNVARWVDAGKYVTSAGVSAGTDLGFHLVSRLAGRAVAETAAIAAEYDWHRDPNLPIFYPQQAIITATSS